MNNEQNEQPKLPWFVRLVDSTRTQNILLGILNMMLILGVFFLGFTAAGWTNDQIESYCHDYNELKCMDIFGPGSTTNFTIPIEDLNID